MADKDLLAPDMRRVLDILGNNGHIVEWRFADHETIIVVWPNETASWIEVRGPAAVPPPLPDGASQANF